MTDSPQKYIFLGKISHVRDKFKFYVTMEHEYQNFYNAMQSVNVEELEQMFWIPAVDEIFILESKDDGLLRAKRITGCEENKFHLQLIDTGEEFSFASDKIPIENFFVLPNQLIELPPLALKAIWTRNIVHNINFEVDTFLESSLYETFWFEVIDIDENEEIIANILIYKEEKKTNNEKDVKQKKTPTKEEIELRELFKEEESCTSNPMKAIQGFVSHDDDHRCRFSNATGGCWKGGHCNLEHVVEIDASRDRKSIFYYDHNPAPLPELYTYYDVKITSFITTDRFYCHYNVDFFYCGKSLQQLRNKINDPSKVASYLKLKELPGVNELVLVKLDKNFFRAQVLNQCDEFLSVTILLVDEGKIIDNVNYSVLYQYYSQLMDFPFFAIEIEIADAKPLNDKKEEIAVMKKLEDMCVNKVFKAFVIQNFPSIICILRTNEDLSVANLMIENGLADPKIPIIFSSNNSKLIPV